MAEEFVERLFPCFLVTMKELYGFFEKKKKNLRNKSSLFQNNML